MWKKCGRIFSKHWAQLPVVDNSYSDFYRIYYSRRVDDKSLPMFVDVERSDPSNIIGESSGPILPLGELGTFDQAGVMPAEIVTLEDKKYLFYIGWTNRKDVPYFNTIGLAVSFDDGHTFRKFSTGPVIGCSHIEPGYTGTISIMVEDGTWKAWYLSCRKWEKIGDRVEPFYDIKYAESLNGIDWFPQDKTCIPLVGDEGGISQASVIKLEGEYHMWFSARKASSYRTIKKNSYRIVHATSQDGISWKRTDDLGLFPSEIESNWDSFMVEYPYVVEKDKKKLLMFYNGNGFGKEGIGYAEIEKNSLMLRP